MMSEVDPLKLYWTKDLFHKSVLFVGLCRSSTVPMLNVCFKMNQIWEKQVCHTPKGAAGPKSQPMDPGPKITWGVGIAFVATLRHHLDRPPAYRLSRGSELGMPQGGENCRFRGWPLKIAQSWAPSPNINIGSLQEEGHCTSLGQLWPNYLFFFQKKDWTEHFVHGPCLCWDTPESRCKSKMIPSAPAASRYANSYQKETAPRPSRTCQREATKVNQHPQNFLGQGDTKLSFTEFFPKRKCHWNLMFHSLYVLQVENHVGHVCKYSTSSRYVYTIVQ